jgi:hypothetical protein
MTPMITETRATPRMNLTVMRGEPSADWAWVSKEDEVWTEVASDFLLLFLFDGMKMVDPVSLDLTSNPSLGSAGLPPSLCNITKYEQDRKNWSKKGDFFLLMIKGSAFLSG